MEETKVITLINDCVFMSSAWTKRANENARNSMVAERVMEITDYCADGTEYSRSEYTDEGCITLYKNKSSDVVEYEYTHVNGEAVLKSRTSRHSPVGTVYYAYDEDGRKISEFDTSTGICTQFTYDKTHTHTVVKSVRHTPGRSPIFENATIDKYGRPVESIGKNIFREYTYDDENLTSRTVVKKSKKNNTEVSSDITCKYDQYGRLIMKRDNLRNRVTMYNYLNGLAIQESQTVCNVKANGDKSKSLTYDVKITARY